MSESIEEIEELLIPDLRKFFDFSVPYFDAYEGACWYLSRHTKELPDLLEEPYTTSWIDFYTGPYVGGLSLRWAFHKRSSTIARWAPKMYVKEIKKLCRLYDPDAAAAGRKIRFMPPVICTDEEYEKLKAFIEQMEKDRGQS